MVRGGQIQERWSRMVRNGQKPERWSERKGELGRVMGVEGGHQRKGRQRKPERRGGPKCLEKRVVEMSNMVRDSHRSSQDWTRARQLVKDDQSVAQQTQMSKVVTE